MLKRENIKNWSCRYFYFFVVLIILVIIKNFPADSFYSWVYAQNCGYWEILSLKNHGIGHPPLFHFFQKFIKDILPGYHFIYLRLVNFFTGSIFIILFIPYLKKIKSNHFFLVSLTLSATILDTYVFGRMWGLVLLFALLLFILGEEYIQEQSIGNLSKLLTTFLLGLSADYNFILLAPYFFIVLFKNTRWRKALFITAVGLLICIWFRTFHYAVINGDVTQAIYKQLSGVIELHFLFTQLFLNFNYMELMALPILILLFYLFIDYRSKRFSIVHQTLLFIIFITLLFFLVYLDIMRIRYVSFLAPLFLFLLYKLIRNFHVDKIWSDVNIRIIVSIILGSTIILIMNPIFWTDLVEQRFILIFFPMLSILIYKNFSKRILNLLGVFFILSGINYAFSAKVSNSFPSTILNCDKPIIYEAPRAYATQYLKNKKKGDNPMFLSLDAFQKSCKVCTMGTSEINFLSLNEFMLISWEQGFPDSLLIKGFKIKNSSNIGLTTLDQWQLKYLTPFVSNHFKLYEMERVDIHE